MFEDRRDAGRALAAALDSGAATDSVVLALPRGGVVVADEISRLTGAPMDLVFVRKIGLPGHEELALGAVAEGNNAVTIPEPEIAAEFGFDAAAIARLAERERGELERRRRLYLGEAPRLPLSGRTVIVVDDGIATGATMLAAIASARARGARKIICAVPVAPAQVLRRLAEAADETLCLETPKPFYAVGEHYRDFAQVTDREVIAIMSRHRGEAGPTG
jgi:putative phosphoribosyl transferase